ncbi:hypothetical protein BLNAU_22548 [Blattamonas nauphoetae]|uniref:Uncharacterized protein n=1 Tax=Blattamonas nauphoetae TaxID=2049346 RepID=A0ABQ9WSU1_9EUKA|nr:hypothetical protein BLNAU_22548 [Blattamonas nauphoetae]
MMRQCFISSSRQTQEAAASSTVLLSQEQIHSPVVESKNLTALELAQLDLLRFANEHTNKISSPSTEYSRRSFVLAGRRKAGRVLIAGIAVDLSSVERTADIQRFHCFFKIPFFIPSQYLSLVR